jgi:uncharacterized membrane protein YoaK (UPF0700 family)
VFASSQSGNLLKTGLALVYNENPWTFLRPVLAFAAGIVLAAWLQDSRSIRAWHRILLAAETALIVIGALLPSSSDAIANILFSAVCGMQAAGFSRFRHLNMTTVTVNSSFQKAVEKLSHYLHTKNPQALMEGALYALAAAAYLCGVLLGACLSKNVGRLSALAAALFPCAAIVLITITKKNR